MKREKERERQKEWESLVHQKLLEELGIDYRDLLVSEGGREIKKEKETKRERKLGSWKTS